ncbi:MFS transporter [Paenibacillus sp. GCM10012307]|uniref:MFS transporter n=1 Tax=Paenibacillus roseus TaxID=2798579 RepID=A0A934MT91_9BACL|nr:MFS transporter [Paenibacillus roseus]MBJ6359832.1 MFS transporter [Paenibacillus roseus]
MATTPALESPESDLSPTASKEVARMRTFSFAFYTTTAVVISYFPLYFQDRGYSEQQIGILYSIGPALAIFANLLAGMASDRFRTIRKIMMILLAGQLAMLSLLFTSADFIAVCFIMAGFYFFQTPLNPLNDSLILLSVKHTGRKYPSIRIFGSIGFAVAALVIGQFLKSSGSGATMVAGIVTIIISLGLSFTLKDYQQTSAPKVQYSGFLKLVSKPDVIIFFLLLLLLSIAHRMNDGFLAVAMRQMGADESLVGMAWMVSAVSEIPVLFLLGKYGHKFKDLPLLAFAGLGYALRFWLLSRVEAPEWAVLIQALHSISFGVFFSTALRYMTHLIPDEFRASGQALFAVIWTGIAGLLSGLIGGYVLEVFGRGTFFEAAAWLALLGAAGFLIKHIRAK